jgi:hypothetical protein
MSEELWKAVQEYIQAEVMYTSLHLVTPAASWKQADSKEERKRAIAKVETLLTLDKNYATIHKH